MPENNDWATPQNIFDELDKEFNFGIDVCAAEWNHKCDLYITKEKNAFGFDWGGHGSVWMNPPYGREIGKWAKKAYEESRKGATVVCLIPGRTETKWFHDYLINGEIRFVKGRVHFSDINGKSGRPRFSSIIVILRPEDYGYRNKSLIQNPSNKTN